MSRIDDIIVDNTVEFTAPEDFASLEELMNWVHNVARFLGVVIIKKRSKFSKKNEIRKIWLACDRGGEYKDIGSSRDTQTKKIGCPFELVASRNLPPNNSWKLNVVCGIHTHANATNFEGHAVAMRLNDDEKQLVADLTSHHVKPREILSIIKARNKDNFSSMRNVYNERNKIKSSIYGDNTAMDALLTALEARCFSYEFQKNDETNKLENLFFCHPISLGIWGSFPQVLLIDATYKTNRYNMPLVEMVGVTSTNTTFSIAYAFINKEKVDNYVWLLNQLRQRLRQEIYPNVIVTDRDLALMKSCEMVFPESHKLLCRWHIWQNIIKRCKPSFNLQGWNYFNHIWDVLINSPNIDIYANNYIRLQQFLHDNQAPGHVFAYLNDNWLDDYKDRFVSAWCDKYRTFDNYTTNRVEGSHAHLKSLLNSSQCKLDQIVERVEDLIKLQHTSIKEKLEKSKIKVLRKLNNAHIFKFLKFKVSHHGLNKIFKEIDRLRTFEEITDENCGCQLRSSCGLPCAHELDFYLTNDLFIPLNDIDIFWRTLDIPNLSTEEDVEVKCDAAIDSFKKDFDVQPKEQKHKALRILEGIFKPFTKIGEPSVHTNIRGRPTTKSQKDKQVFSHQIPLNKESHRHSFSINRPREQFDLNEPPRYSEYVHHDLPTTHFSKGKQVELPQVHSPHTTSYTPFSLGMNDQPQAYNDYVYPRGESMVNELFGEDPFMQNLLNYQPSTTSMYGQYFNQEYIPQGPEASMQHGYDYPEPSKHDEYYYEQPTINEPICYQHPLLHEIPSFFQPYVSSIEDVKGDGNCGFRSIAVGMRRHQDEWPTIRRDLLNELQDNEKEYKVYYDEYDYGRLIKSITYFGRDFAPPNK